MGFSKCLKMLLYQHRFISRLEFIVLRANREYFVCHWQHHKASICSSTVFSNYILRWHLTALRIQAWVGSYLIACMCPKPGWKADLLPHCGNANNCHFGLAPRKWGTVSAGQDQKPTGTPVSRLGGSTLTCLSLSPHSCDNRSSLAVVWQQNLRTLGCQWCQTSPQHRLLVAHVPSSCCCWYVYCRVSQVCPTCPT